MRILINGLVIWISPKATLLQACEVMGENVSRFCYQQKLSIAGNCRMCLVEVGNSPKPQASCAYPLIPNLQSFTDTALVRKAREAVMEFILLNHPLDCPICDQGGECDLQDQSLNFGSDRSRFYFMKTTVVDKFLGPLVKTVMRRCILCTRCIRYAQQIAGISEIGTTNRGGQSEISSYVSKVLETELSGGVIELCPVGWSY
ncbi:unnamed protein product [Discosporangium mesarthrocarpum]